MKLKRAIVTTALIVSLVQQQYITAFIVYNRCEIQADLVENEMLNRYIKRFGYNRAVTEVPGILDQVKEDYIKQCVNLKLSNKEKP